MLHTHVTGFQNIKLAKKIPVNKKNQIHIWLGGENGGRKDN